MELCPGPITLPGTLSVEPNDATGGGSIAFTGSTLTSTGAQTYNAAFVLGGNTVLTSTGGTLTFTSTVDGPFALTLNSAGNEVFNGQVGGAESITDFKAGDALALIGYGTNAVANALATATPTVVGGAASTTITLGDNTKVTFNGVSALKPGQVMGF